MTTIDIDKDDPWARIAALEEENRRLAEEVRRLTVYKEHYAVLDDLVHDGILVIQDFEMKYANARLQELMEYSFEELAGMYFTRFIVPEDIPKMVTAYNLHMSGERDLGLFDFRVMCKSGRIITVTINSSVIEFNGRPAELIVVEDRTAQVDAERRLATTGTTLENLIDNSPNMVAVFDREGGFQKSNAAFEAFLGRSGSGLNLFHDEVVPIPEFREKTAGLTRGETITVVDCWVPASEDDVQWDGQRCLHVNAFPVNTADGLTENHVVIIQDVTAERAAENQQRLLGAAVESTTSAVVVIDARKRIIWANSAMSMMAAPERRDLTGAKIAGVIADDSGRVDIGAVCDAALSGTPFQGEMSIRDADGGERTILATLAPVRNESQRIIHAVALFQDITDARRAVDALRVAESRLRQAEKMEALGLLAGGIAHDFSNVMTLLMSLTDKFDRDERIHREFEAPLTRLSGAIDRARTLVDRLKMFGRREALPIRRLSLNALTRDFVNLVGYSIAPKIRIETQLDPGIPLILADEAGVEQILLNLVVNAKDALPSGGRILMTTGSVEAENAAHMLKNPGRYTVLTVGDNGTGMTEDVRRRVFEPFFTTKPVGIGSGLGLASVYGIVQAHSAEIFVDSEIGKGTQFNVYFPERLPVQDEETAETLPLPSPNIDELSGNETVMIVEDRLEMLYLYQRWLEIAGYSVLPSLRPDAALDVASTHVGPINVLLADLMLPDMNGAELATAVRALRPEMCVVYVSGFDHAVLRENGISVPEGAYLRKPFTADELKKAIRSALDKAAGRPRVASA